MKENKTSLELNNSEKYVELQENFNKIKFFQLNEYDVGYILSYPIGHYVFKKNDGLLKNLLRCIKISFTDRTEFSVKGVSHDFLFLLTHRYMDRKDHRKTMETIASTTPGFTFAYPVDKSRISFRPVNLICIIAWFHQMKSLGTSATGKFHFIYYMLLAKNYLKSVKREINVGEYKVVVFRMDGQLYDNIICQYAKLQGCICVTIQDGYEGERCDNAEYDWQMQPKLRGSVSHYCLAWSDYFAKVINQTVPPGQKIIPLGMPKFINYKRPDSGETRKFFGVLLDTPSEQDCNIELIEIANKIAKAQNIPYILRYHPSQTDGSYNDRTKGVSGVIIDASPNMMEFPAFVDQCRFIIGCNSSTVLECALLNDYVYRFTPSEDKDLLKECEFPNVFSCYDELYKLVENETNVPAAYRNYVCGKNNVRLSYEMFFSSLVAG